MENILKNLIKNSSNQNSLLKIRDNEERRQNKDKNDTTVSSANSVNIEKQQIREKEQEDEGDVRGGGGGGGEICGAVCSLPGNPSVHFSGVEKEFILQVRDIASRNVFDNIDNKEDIPPHTTSSSLSPSSPSSHSSIFENLLFDLSSISEFISIHLNHASLFYSQDKQHVISKKTRKHHHKHIQQTTTNGNNNLDGRINDVASEKTNHNNHNNEKHVLGNFSSPTTATLTRDGDRFIDCADWKEMADWLLDVRMKQLSKEFNMLFSSSPPHPS